MKAPYSAQVVLEAAESLLHRRGFFSFRLNIDGRLKEEEYSIAQDGNTVTIAGGTPSAVMFGAGRLIREPGFRGCSAPDKPFRGIYFATHFGNWYDNAPESEIDSYLEELVIWGCNTVKVWFDRHHFKSISDDAAQAKLKNLKHILRKSAQLGMKNFLTVLANEGYADSPAELRADWVGHKNGYLSAAITGHYHVELCPSKPGAVDLLMQWHGELFDAFSDIPVHYLEIFCYDQGGCTCADCAPYGANGYWKIIPSLSALIREKIPHCKIVVSTWRFGCFIDGEWEFLRRNWELLRKNADMLSVDNCALKELKTLPDDIPAMGFTDVSMRGQLPWGGFGANPMPAFLDTFRQEERLCGNSVYSEGIFEDMNKVILLGSEWDTACSAQDMIRKYAAFYFGEEVCSPVAEAAVLMEQNLKHSAVIRQGEKTYSAYFSDQMDSATPWELSYEMPGLRRDCAEKCLSLVRQAESLMSEERKNSWRWRIFRLRAEIDSLLADGKDPDAAMTELIRIYHCSGRTLPCLVPPAVSVWKKIIAERRPSLV